MLRDHTAKQAVACQDASLAYPPSSSGAPRPAPVALPPKSIGVDGDIGFYVFPQGGGRIRLYAAHGVDQRNRFAGEGAVERFLEAFDLASLPHGASLARARPAGPSHGYPNHDVWIDHPVAPRIVLIGDAAGHNDPSGGQAIRIALKDANADVREQTAFALGQIRDARAIDGLTAALKDVNASVRQQAAFALGQIR